MGKKENRPVACAASGTASTCDYDSTFVSAGQDMTENGLIRTVTEEYLAGIDVEIRPAPEDVERELLQATNNAIEAYNLGPRDPSAPMGAEQKDAYPDQKKGDTRLRLRKHLDPYQIALIVRELHHAVGIRLDDSNSDDNFDIGVYQFDGVNEGIYDTSRLGLERLIRSYDMAISARNVDETVAILRAICSVRQMVKLASRSDAFVEALRRRINDETDVEQLREDAERIGREQAANDKRMRMLMNQIDALDPADRSYERKFNDLQRRLDDLYDRDAGFQEALEETQAKIAAADKRRVGERKLLDELDRIPELLEEADEQTRFDIVHEAVSEVRILADRNPRKERVVQSVTFKCPVRFFWEEVPDVADGYTAVTPDSFDADGNFRDDETHVETVVFLHLRGSDKAACV